MLQRVERLLYSGRGLGTMELFEKLTPEPVQEMPSSRSTIVGTDGKLSEILGHLQNHQVQIIGIYGAGGIGKTTLMKELNNKMLGSSAELQFDTVIWVTVSQDVDINRIQKLIGDGLGLDLPEDLVERARTLSSVLKGMKFLILLDDLWAELHLADVGIPVANTGDSGKIVFTTRLHEVCLDMRAHKYVMMNFLDANTSWELFCSNLSPYIDLQNNPDIQACAVKVASICAGLPLALITIAKAFGGYGNDIHEWESGLETLMNAPMGIRDMEDKLLYFLEFSFERLRSNDLKLCLLYCSLYPYDSDIDIKFITEQWVGERLICSARGYREDFASFRKKTLQIISRLKSVSLLGSSLLGDLYVTMHDSVRDMCLSVTSRTESSSKSMYGNFLVYNTLDDCNRVGFQEWTKVTRVSFINSGIKYLGDERAQRKQRCPSLGTLLLSECQSLTRIYDDFFLFIPSLRVLDLTRAKLEELPKSLFSLLELRFLNLTGTQIEILPKELGNLTNLRQLYIADTLSLRIISLEALSNLSMLQCLSVLTSSFLWELKGSEGNTDPVIRLEDLKELKMLDELGLDIHYVAALDELRLHFSSSTTSKIIELQLVGDEFNGSHVSAAYSTFLRMRRLWISSCFNVEELVFSGGHTDCLEGIVLINNTNLRNIRVTGEEIAHEEGDTDNVPVEIIPKGSHFPLSYLRVIYAQGCHFLQDLSCVWHIPTLVCIRLFDCCGLEVILPTPTSHHVPMGSRKMPLPNLQFLQLGDLSSLKRISSICPLSFPSLQTLQVFRCPELKELPFDLQSANNIKSITGSWGWWNNIEWDDEDIARALFHHFQPSS